jgi:hypothetical protein
MISIFLGAGFSYVGYVPLASQLFNEEPEVDRISRQRLVGRVLKGWEAWNQKHGGAPEEYLAFLQTHGGRSWLDAVWYVALVIALKMGNLEYVGMKPTITRHNINRTSQVPIHETFWSTIFKRTNDVTVLTTNYDILAERGLRYMPRPRVHRPGFHYGFGVEALAGGGYPSYSHIQKIAVSGNVPLLKLHGSVSWSYREGKLIRYHDCRPAIRGDAAIVAPVTQKTLPEYLQPFWHRAADALASSNIWIFVGYSLPEYDRLIRDLLWENRKHNPTVHVFDPDPNISLRYSDLLPSASVVAHPGFPSGLNDLESIVSKLT